MKTMQEAPNRRRGRRLVPGPAGSGGQTFVGVFKAQYRSQARCGCGWIGTARLLQASARVDALIHAARNDCVPTIPLVQSWRVATLSPPRRGRKEQLSKVHGSCHR